MAATIPVGKVQGGKVQKNDCPCEVCGDRGIVANIKAVKVTIPAGSKDGSLLRLAGEGAAGPNGGTPGDLYLTLRVTDFDGEYDSTEIFAEMDKEDDSTEETEIDEPTNDASIHEESSEPVEEEAEAIPIPVGADVGYFRR